MGGANNPALTKMAYGTHSDVAALARLWTANGVFNATTNPTQTQVTGWLDQISGLMDVALNQSGFTTPVTQADAVLALKSLVVAVVKDLCDNSNSAGRFFSQAFIESGQSPFTVIPKTLRQWVDENADGLEKLGVERTTDPEAKMFSVPLQRQT